MIRFCVLSTPRSGSTWLTDLLNMQEGVRACSEVFLREASRAKGSFFEERLGEHEAFDEFYSRTGGRRPYCVWRYLKHLEAGAPECRAVGFKVMYNQLRRIPELWPIVTLRRYRIIHLVRRNVADTVLSREFRRRHLPEAHRQRPVAGGLQVAPEPAYFAGEVARTDRYIRRMRAFTFWWPMPSLDIVYEDLCRDPGGQVRRALRFLGVPAGNVSLDSPFTRVAAGTRKERLANYDAVAAALRQAGYGHFLDDA
ncbi:MAG: sulfotransferase [Lentisphaerae bacterium]|nr:sulfotransferase [Lentisphaerota bacterium]